MIDIFLITQMIAANPETQKLCAAAVGIPYASDNFTDDEWRQFQRCMTFFERQQQHQKRPEAPASASATPLPVLVIDTLFDPLPDA